MAYGAVRNIVVHYVIATSIRTEMLGKSTVGMCYGYFMESGITGQFGFLEQKFQVHHVVNDNRTFPASFTLPAITLYIPALNDSGIGAETRTK